MSCCSAEERIEMVAENAPTPDLPVAARVWESVGKPAAGLAGMALRGVLGSRTSGTLGILLYHRTAPNIVGAPKPTWNVTPQRFRRQLSGLLAAGYRPVALRDALARHRRGEAPGPREFIVTFDDAYQCVYEHAWPILLELNIPATIFVPTAYLDSHSPMPFDQWSAAGSSSVPASAWRCMTSDECQTLIDSGLIEIGSHTHTHSDFRGQPGEFSSDLQTSLERLRDRFRLTEAPFAFPFGRRSLGFCSDELTDAARRSGVLCSLTTESELVGKGSDPFTWGRFTVTESDTPATLQMKLDGWYGAARTAWRWSKSLGRPSRAGAST
jgi:peptidoglycan/xylan/chitin deacetylase (PgdA/CDA1 family)